MMAEYDFREEVVRGMECKVQSIGSINVNKLSSNSFKRLTDFCNLIEDSGYDIWVVCDINGVELVDLMSYKVLMDEGGDVAVFVKKDLSVENVFLSRHLIRLDSGEGRIIGIYNKPDSCNIWALVEYLKEHVNEKTVIAGDFNCILRREDISSGKLRNRDKKLGKWMAENSFFDLAQEVNLNIRPTFGRMVAGKRIFSRVDLVLGTEYWRRKTRGFLVRKFDSTGVFSTDHMSIVWTARAVNEKVKRKRFPEKKLGDPRFRTFVRKWIKSKSREETEWEYTQFWNKFWEVSEKWKYSEREGGSIKPPQEAYLAKLLSKAKQRFKKRDLGDKYDIKAVKEVLTEESKGRDIYDINTSFKKEVLCNKWRLKRKVFFDIVKKAAWGKACGPNGITNEVIKVFRKELFPVFRFWFKKLAEGTLNQNELLEMKRGWIVMVPKANSSEGRPITLLNMDWKILTKVLNDMLFAEIALHLDSDQIGFVPKRWIHEAHAILLHVLRKKLGKVAFVDVANAYNAVCHKWIKFSIKKMFGKQLSRLIERLLGGRSTFVQSGEEIICTRGVRQGDAISPLIFNLALIPFLELCRQRLKGINIRDFGLLFLVYADDFVFFYKDDEELERISECFELLAKDTGLIINYKKSGIFGKVGESCKRWICVESYKYLGLTVDEKGSIDWEPMKEKLRKATNSCLNKFGWCYVTEKKMLWNSFIVSKIVYGLKIENIKGTGIKEVYEECYRKFFGRTPSLERACSSVNNGGFEVLDIKKYQKRLLATWIPYLMGQRNTNSSFSLMFAKNFRKEGGKRMLIETFSACKMVKCKYIKVVDINSIETECGVGTKRGIDKEELNCEGWMIIGEYDCKGRKSSKLIEDKNHMKDFYKEVEKLKETPQWTKAQCRWMKEEFDLKGAIEMAKQFLKAGRWGAWLLDCLAVNLKVAYRTTCGLCGDLIGSDHFRTCNFHSRIVSLVGLIDEGKMSKRCMSWIIWWKAFCAKKYGKSFSDENILGLWSWFEKNLKRRIKWRIKKKEVKMNIKKRIACSNYYLKFNDYPAGENEVFVFSDGSLRKNDEAGAGVAILPFKKEETELFSYKISGWGKWWTEVIALKAAIEMAKKLKQEGKVVRVFSDSEVAINRWKKSKIPFQESDWEVNITKVPSHVGIVGNELADIMAGNTDVRKTAKLCEEYLGCRCKLKWWG
jgi:ribonuclease HI